MPHLFLGSSHVAELVAELAPRVAHLVVRDAHALPPADLVLVLVESLEDTRSRRVFLRVSADPDGARICADRSRVSAHTGPLGPFFRACQTHLTGARLVKLSQVAGDRLVALEFKCADDHKRTLIAELVGRHANMVLLGGSDIIEHVLVPAETRLKVGAAWTPPPGRATQGTRTALVDVFPEPAAAPRLAPDETSDPYPLSWRVNCALQAQAAYAHSHRERKDLLERLERRLKNAHNLLAGLEQRRQAAEGHERVRWDAELLKLHLTSVPRGAKSVDLEDLYNEGQTRTVSLDPKLSVRDNMERLFEKAKKLERAQTTIVEELALAQAKHQRLADFVARAKDEAESVDDLERAAIAGGVLDPKQAAPQKQAAPAPRLPYRTFVGKAGSEIRVGRNAKDNDALTFKHARGNDLWLHTADTPGSHVVLVLAGKPEAHPEELLDAAHLAVHFSPLEGATKARVHVAPRKLVHKPRGAKPGLVTLSGGKVLDLRLQPERLQRLLGAHRPSAS